MNEAAIHLMLRYTARTTFVLFVSAFAGNALRDLWPRGFTVWLAKKRDWFLVAMAVSHTVHLAAIVALFQTIGWAKLRLLTLAGGGFVYALIYLLAAHAFMRLRSGGQGPPRISPKLESVALYLIWLIFALAFVPRIISGWPVYSLLGGAALVALAIRIACLVRHKRSRAAVA